MEFTYKINDVPQKKSKERIYIGFLDKRNIIAMFYDYFLTSQIERYLNWLEPFVQNIGDIRAQIIKTDITTKDLDNLVNAGHIGVYKSVGINIEFDDEDIVIDENQSDYITPLFAYMDDKQLFEMDNFQKAKKDLENLQKEQNSISQRINEYKYQKNVCLKAEKEDLKILQWSAEEGYYSLELMIYAKKKKMIKELGTIIKLQRQMVKK